MFGKRQSSYQGMGIARGRQRSSSMNGGQAATSGPTEPTDAGAPTPSRPTSRGRPNGRSMSLSPTKRSQSLGLLKSPSGTGMNRPKDDANAEQRKLSSSEHKHPSRGRSRGTGVPSSDTKRSRSVGGRTSNLSQAASTALLVGSDGQKNASPRKNSSSQQRPSGEAIASISPAKRRELVTSLNIPILDPPKADSTRTRQRSVSQGRASDERIVPLSNANRSRSTSMTRQEQATTNRRSLGDAAPARRSLSPTKRRQSDTNGSSPSNAATKVTEQSLYRRRPSAEGKVVARQSLNKKPGASHQSQSRAKSTMRSGRELSGNLGDGASGSKSEVRGRNSIAKGVPTQRSRSLGIIGRRQRSPSLKNRARPARPPAFDSNKFPSSQGRGKPVEALSNRRRSTNSATVEAGGPTVSIVHRENKKDNTRRSGANPAMQLSLLDNQSVVSSRFEPFHGANSLSAKDMMRSPSSGESQLNKMIALLPTIESEDSQCLPQKSTEKASSARQVAEKITSPSRQPFSSLFAVSQQETPSGTATRSQSAHDRRTSRHEKLLATMDPTATGGHSPQSSGTVADVKPETSKRPTLSIRGLVVADRAASKAPEENARSTSSRILSESNEVEKSMRSSANLESPPSPSENADGEVKGKRTRKDKIRELRALNEDLERDNKALQSKLDTITWKGEESIHHNVDHQESPGRPVDATEAEREVHVLQSQLGATKRESILREKEIDTGIREISSLRMELSQAMEKIDVMEEEQENDKSRLVLLAKELTQVRKALNASDRELSDYKYGKRSSSSASTVSSDYDTNEDSAEERSTDDSTDVDGSSSHSRDNPRINLLQHQNDMLRKELEERMREFQDKEKEQAKVIESQREDQQRVESNLRKELEESKSALLRLSASGPKGDSHDIEMDVLQLEAETRMLQYALREANENNRLLQEQMMEMNRDDSSDAECEACKRLTDVEATNKGLEGKVSQLESELKEARDKSRKLEVDSRNASNSLKAEKADLLSALDDFKAKNSNLEKQSAQLRSRTGALEMEMELLKSVNQDLKRDAESLRSQKVEAKSLAASNARLQQEKRQIQHEAESLRYEKAELETRLLCVVKEANSWEQAASMVDNDRKGLEQKLNTTKRSLTDLQREYQTVVNRNSELEANVKELRHERDSLQNSSDQFKAQAVKASSAVSNAGRLEESLKQAESEIHRLRRSNKKLLVEKQLAEEERMKLRAQVEDSEARYRALRQATTNHDQLERRNEHLIAEKESLIRQQKMFEEQLANLVKDRDELRKSHQRNQAVKQATESSQLALIRRKLEEKTLEVEGLIAFKKEIEAQLSQLHAERDGLKQIISSFESQMEALKGTNAALEEEMSAYESLLAETDQLRDDAAEMEALVAGLSQELSEAQVGNQTPNQEDTSQALVDVIAEVQTKMRAAVAEAGELRENARAQQKKIEEIEKERDEWQSSAEELEKELESLSSKTEIANRQASTADEELRAAKQSMDQLSMMTNELQRQLTEKELEKEDWKAKTIQSDTISREQAEQIKNLQQRTASFETLEANVMTMREETTKLRHENEDLARQRDELKGVQSELERLSSQKEESDREAHLSSERLRSVQQVVGSCRSVQLSTADLENELIQKEKEIDEWKNRAKEAEALSVKQAKEIDSLQTNSSTIESLRLENEAIGKKVTTLESEKEELLCERDELKIVAEDDSQRIALELLQKEFTILNEEADRAQEKVRQLDDDLERARDERDEQEEKARLLLDELNSARETISALEELIKVTEEAQMMEDQLTDLDSHMESLKSERDVLMRTESTASEEGKISRLLSPCTSMGTETYTLPEESESYMYSRSMSIDSESMLMKPGRHAHEKKALEFELARTKSMLYELEQSNEELMSHLDRVRNDLVLKTTEMEITLKEASNSSEQAMDEVKQKFHAELATWKQRELDLLEVQEQLEGALHQANDDRDRLTREAAEAAGEMAVVKDRIEAQIEAHKELQEQQDLLRQTEEDNIWKEKAIHLEQECEIARRDLEEKTVELSAARAEIKNKEELYRADSAAQKESLNEAVSLFEQSKLEASVALDKIADVERLTTEKGSLQKELGRLTMERDSMKEELDLTRQDLDKLRETALNNQAEASEARAVASSTRADMIRLQNKIRELQVALEDSNARLGQVEEERERATDRFNHAQARAVAIEMESQNSLAEKEREVLALKNEVSQFVRRDKDEEADRALLVVENQQLSMELASLRGTAAELRKDNDKYMEEAVVLSNQISYVQVVLEGKEDEFAAQEKLSPHISGLIAQVEALRSKAETMERERNEAQAEETRIRSAAEQAQLQLDNMENAFAASVEKSEALERKNKVYSEEVKEMESELEKLRASLHERHQMATHLEDEVSKLRCTADDQQKQLTTMKQTNAETLDRERAGAQILSELQSKLAQKQQEFSQLEEQSKSWGVERDAYSEKVECLSAQVQELQLVVDATGSLEQHADQNADLQTALNQKQNELALLKVEAEELRKENLEYSTRVKSLCSELLEAHSVDSGELTQEGGESASELAQLRRSIENLQGEVKDISTERDEWRAAAEQKGLSSASSSTSLSTDEVTRTMFAEKIDHLHEQILTYSTQIEELHKECESWRELAEQSFMPVVIDDGTCNSCIELKKQLVELRERNETLESQVAIEAMTTERWVDPTSGPELVDNLRRRNSDLEVQVQVLTSECDDCKGRSSEEIDELQNQKAALERRIEECVNELEEWKTQCSQHAEDLYEMKSTMKSQVDELATERDHWKEKYGITHQLRLQIVELETRLEASIEALELEHEKLCTESSADPNDPGLSQNELLVVAAMAKKRKNERSRSRSRSRSRGSSWFRGKSNDKATKSLSDSNIRDEVSDPLSRQREEFEDTIEDRELTIAQLRGEIVELNSTLKSENHANVKKIEELTSENLAYGLKVSACQTEVAALENDLMQLQLATIPREALEDVLKEKETTEEQLRMVQRELEDALSSSSYACKESVDRQLETANEDADRYKSQVEALELMISAINQEIASEFGFASSEESQKMYDNINISTFVQGSAVLQAETNATDGNAREDATLKQALTQRLKKALLENEDLVKALQARFQVDEGTVSDGSSVGMMLLAIAWAMLSAREGGLPSSTTSVTGGEATD